MPCSKHRGVVLSNVDPLAMGRLQVEVPGVIGASFALPCVPFAGPGVGFLALPPVGANVWVEFEENDLGRPIWTGCFWNAGEAPDGAADAPQKKIIQTDSVGLTLDDTPGAGFSMVVQSAGATLTLRLTAAGVVVDNGRGAEITLAGPVVTINQGALTVL
jgi:uncharacterized protein involved in type VI secretion and phage assembly